MVGFGASEGLKGIHIDLIFFCSVNFCELFGVTLECQSIIACIFFITAHGRFVL